MSNIIEKPFIREPYKIGDVAVWQGCYVCGMSITFNNQKDIGKWIAIGDGLIRHKKCIPMAAR